MPSEFGIIKKFFTEKSLQKNKSTRLGIGDDAAIVSVPSGYDMVIAVDTLVAGVHFPKQTSPFDIGYKALAVNLSDLAAMGAQASSFTLALTLSESEQNQNWLENFSSGLFELANKINIELVGGDTTYGPLTISIQAHGLIPINKAMLRSGAKPGDLVFVTGTLGDAALGLQCVQKKPGTNKNTSVDLQNELTADEKEYCLSRLNQPQPQVIAGLQLRDIATSCIDVSDGLLADLGHICEASKCSAVIHESCLPLSSAFEKYHSIDTEATILAATGGDDYELCFTVNPSDLSRLKKLDLNCSITQVGEIFSLEQYTGLEIEPVLSETNVTFLDKAGEVIPVTTKGYSHFQE